MNKIFKTATFVTIEAILIILAILGGFLSHHYCSFSCPGPYACPQVVTPCSVMIGIIGGVVSALSLLVFLVYLIAFVIFKIRIYFSTKALALLLLIIGIVIVGLEAWLTYFPPSGCPPCPKGALCAPCGALTTWKEPGEIFPLWFPPIPLAIWIYSLVNFRKQKVGFSLVLSLALILLPFLTSEFLFGLRLLF